MSENETAKILREIISEHEKKLDEILNQSIEVGPRVTAMRLHTLVNTILKSLKVLVGESK